MASKVRLNLSNIQSHWGWYGVVLVFLVSSMLHMVEDFWFELASLIRMTLFWYTIPAHKFFYQKSGDCHGFHICHRVDLRPLREVIGNDEYVAVSSRRCRHGSHNVYGTTLKGLPRLILLHFRLLFTLWSFSCCTNVTTSAPIFNMPSISTPVVVIPDMANSLLGHHAGALITVVVGLI